MGTTLGRFEAAHQRVHRYLPTCLHNENDSKTGAERDICVLRGHRGRASPGAQLSSVHFWASRLSREWSYAKDLASPETTFAAATMAPDSRGLSPAATSG